LIFRSKTAAHVELKGKELIYPCKTRFGTNVDMLQRCLELKVPLQEFAVDPLFRQSKNYDATLYRKLLSEPFWDHIQNALLIMRPAYTLLKYVDGECPQIGELYDRIREVGRKLRAVDGNDAHHALNLYEERLHGAGRKVPLHYPIHTAAMMLTPKNWEAKLQEKLHNEYGEKRHCCYKTCVQNTARCSCCFVSI
jgi:hypothetical protein